MPKGCEQLGLRPVALSKTERDSFYLGFANATLWPLYHDAVRTPRFERTWWDAYVSINARFARAAAQEAGGGARVWVHDYQLQLVPKMLRDLRPDLRIGYFLHIPFPPRELFMQLPWRREIIEGLLGADLVGFQVPGAASNFSEVARQLVDVGGTSSLIEHASRHVRVGAFPISVDASHLIERSRKPAVQERAREIRAGLGDPDLIMLGVDRLDYTKGIDRKMRAVGELFADGRLQAGRHVLVQIAVPTRENDAHYQQERHHLEQLVGEINGRFGEVGHPVIQYLNQSVSNDELISLYLAADILLVTPLRDGMNLVAKEYVATRTDGRGRLILSEFAGAAAELKEAILVNPHDTENMKAAVAEALDLDEADARSRMNALRGVVQRHDVHHWAKTFLVALQAAPPAKPELNPALGPATVPCPDTWVPLKPLRKSVGAGVVAPKPLAEAG
jgi:trehalose 6-phosphate synthase